MIVVDASVLANALADDGNAGRVSRRALAEDTELAAPDLVDVETQSVLRRRWLAGFLHQDVWEQAVEDLEALPLVRYPALPFLRRAFELRQNVTPYDSMYVALAEVLDCSLLTSDGRLARAPGPKCAVVLLS